MLRYYLPAVKTNNGKEMNTMVGNFITYKAPNTVTNSVGFVILESDIHVTVVDAGFNLLLSCDVSNENIAEVAIPNSSQLEHLKIQAGIQSARADIGDSGRELVRLVSEAVASQSGNIITNLPQATTNKIKLAFRKFIVWIYS